ncbi:MAG TPA: SRPBCC domain-containing protein [Acidimicrobiales bacterium]|nr:SRPBCC domain-containing protein [Acidimicrobiales bacterium]
MESLRLSFEIRCTVDHAFETWATRFSSWWPKGHSASGNPDTTVVLEPGVGGRIFERTPDGTEIAWGEITHWDPPHRLDYLWHISRDRKDATDVELHFVDIGDGTTRLDIVHSGWERLGAEGQSWRQANTRGWDALVPRFIGAAEA